MSITQPRPAAAPAALVGDDVTVPCLDGTDRRYIGLDAAASTGALPAVAAAVQEFLPLYSSVHRGAGWKSRHATARYEAARTAALGFAGADPARSTVIFCRHTTDAINHLAFRLQLAPADVVVTTALEHHANLLPWQRACRLRVVDCEADGTLDPAAVISALRRTPRARLLAITAASNVTGWTPDLGPIIEAAHDAGVPVFVDAAQLAAHRPLPREADFVAWSGHKMYAPFGAGVLVGPLTTFAEGAPYQVGGGAVDLVDFDSVEWTEPPDRDEAGSPNVIGAIALHAAVDALDAIGWEVIHAHDSRLAARMRQGLAAIPGVRLLGPSTQTSTLAVAPFLVDGLPHALVAARLSWEFAIGVRHGCFCAHPYLMRLLGLPHEDVERIRAAVRAGDRTAIPGAVRASASLATTDADVDALLTAVATIAGDGRRGSGYDQDARTGEWWPSGRPPEPGLGGACVGL